MTTETRGPMEQWVYERCRWCFAECDTDRICRCEDELCDEQHRMRRDEPLFDFAREQDRKMAALVEALEAYERWEADLILSNEAWDGGAADYPTLTPELYGRLITIQGLRNAALAAVKGEPR